MANFKIINSNGFLYHYEQVYNYIWSAEINVFVKECNFLTSKNLVTITMFSMYNRKRIYSENCMLKTLFFIKRLMTNKTNWKNAFIKLYKINRWFINCYEHHEHSYRIILPIICFQHQLFIHRNGHHANQNWQRAVKCICSLLKRNKILWI